MSPTSPMNPVGAPDPALRAAVLGVLAGVRAWRLPAARWPAVLELLQELEAALAAGAPDEAAAVAAELEVMGPDRVVPAGSAPPSEQPPPRVLERLNHLVHSLGGVTARPQPSS